MQVSDRINYKADNAGLTRPSGRILALAAALSMTGAAFSHAAVLTFTSGTDLADAGNYTGGSPGNSNDILFDVGYPAAPATFSLSASLATQSINSVNANAITVTQGTSRTLTLGNPSGQANGVSGAAASDLIYVGGDGDLTLGANLPVALAQSGNFNVAGGRTLSVSSVISGASVLTKTGDGTLTLSGSNTFSNLVIKAGTVHASSGSGGRFGSGSITLGEAAGTSDVTLSALDGTAVNPIIVNAVASGTILITHNAGSGTAQNPIFSGAITLNGALSIAERRSADRVITISGQITGDKTISILSNNNSAKPGVSITNVNNASSFTGNVVVAGGLLGFENGSLGSGAITFDPSAPGTTGASGLVWRPGNTQDVSGNTLVASSGVSARLDTGTNDVTFATVNGLTGSGGFTKSGGTGTLNLAVSNNYTGNTTVSAGTLLVNNASGSATGSGNVAVNANATLGGAGIIGGTVTVQGTSGNLAYVSPGNSAGTLTINSLNLNNFSAYIFEGGDLINVSDTLDLNSGWTLSLREGLVDGGSVTLFSYGTLASSPHLTPTIDGSQLDFTPSGTLYLENDTENKLVILHGVQAVPEPAGLSLLALGGLAALRRRVR